MPRAVAPLRKPGDASRACRLRRPVPLREIRRGRRKIPRGNAALHDGMEQRYGGGVGRGVFGGLRGVRTVPGGRQRAPSTLVELTGAVAWRGRARPQVSVVLCRGLIARSAEQERIESLLAEAREGRSGALVIRGEAGLGKTALLDWAIERANGFHVLHTAGVNTDSRASLHRAQGALPDSPRPAHSTAFGPGRGPRRGA